MNPSYMLGQLKWVHFALATVAVNVAVMRAAAAAAAHFAYYERALVREQRGQCPKGACAASTPCGSSPTG